MILICPNTNYSLNIVNELRLANVLFLSPSKLGLTIHMKYYRHRLIFVDGKKLVPIKTSCMYY